MQLAWNHHALLGATLYACLKASITVMKHQKQDRKERIYLISTSTSLFIVKGSQSRKSNSKGTWRGELVQRSAGLLLWICSVWFHLEPMKDHQPTDGII